MVIDNCRSQRAMATWRRRFGVRHGSEPAVACKYKPMQAWAARRAGRGAEAGRLSALGLEADREVTPVLLLSGLSVIAVGGAGGLGHQRESLIEVDRQLKVQLPLPFGKLDALASQTGEQFAATAVQRGQVAVATVAASAFTTNSRRISKSTLPAGAPSMSSST